MTEYQRGNYNRSRSTPNFYEPNGGRSYSNNYDYNGNDNRSRSFYNNNANQGRNYEGYNMNRNGNWNNGNGYRAPVRNNDDYNSQGNTQRYNSGNNGRQYNSARSNYNGQNGNYRGSRNDNAGGYMNQNGKRDRTPEVRSRANSQFNDGRINWKNPIQRNSSCDYSTDPSVSDRNDKDWSGIEMAERQINSQASKVQRGGRFSPWNMLKEIDDHPHAEKILSQASHEADVLPYLTEKRLEKMGADIQITRTPKKDIIIRRPEKEQRQTLSRKHSYLYGNTLYDSSESEDDINGALQTKSKTGQSTNETTDPLNKCMDNLDSTQYAELPAETTRQIESSHVVDESTTPMEIDELTINVSEKMAIHPLSWKVKEFETQGQAGVQILVWGEGNEPKNSGSISNEEETILINTKSTKSKNELRTEGNGKLSSGRGIKEEFKRQAIVPESRELSPILEIQEIRTVDNRTWPTITANNVNMNTSVQSPETNVSKFGEMGDRTPTFSKSPGASFHRTLEKREDLDDHISAQD
ncbi:hypothetical protein QAD02_008379 [Eretmocerus hayati]|uniref:Uncharacterized protein n=1 Tax=Eretmocerus hayati TaxID=131215 RepID=A0ACC2N8P9_9HYME|nr:hypothetical protein QAD02_008379 [Eretmocerus hayati]